MTTSTATLLKNVDIFHYITWTKSAAEVNSVAEIIQSYLQRKAITKDAQLNTHVKLCSVQKAQPTVLLKVQNVIAFSNQWQPTLAWAVSQHTDTSQQEHQGYIKMLAHAVQLDGVQYNIGQFSEAGLHE